MNKKNHKQNVEKWCKWPIGFLSYVDGLGLLGASEHRGEWLARRAAFLGDMGAWIWGVDDDGFWDRGDLTLARTAVIRRCPKDATLLLDSRRQRGCVGPDSRGRRNKGTCFLLYITYFSFCKYSELTWILLRSVLGTG